MSTLNSQREMRSAFLGGFARQLVSGLIWLVSAAGRLEGRKRRSLNLP